MSLALLSYDKLLPLARLSFDTIKNYPFPNAHSWQMGSPASKGHFSTGVTAPNVNLRPATETTSLGHHYSPIGSYGWG